MDPSPLRRRALATGLLVLLFSPSLPAVEETVATAVYSRIGNGYQRERLKDGSFKPEYYALSNGGRIYGTTSDITVERVTYPEVAEIAMRLLAGQNYHYASSQEQAKLLLVLQWGNTIAFNRSNYDTSIGVASSALAELMQISRDGGAITGSAADVFSQTGGNAQDAVERFEAEMMKLLMDNRVRDQINERNAKVIGYLDEVNEADGIQRWAGAGDRYRDLIDDLEESRYYIVISAYDFPELVKHEKKKLLWQTRVSVRSPGNRFDDSFAAMLKGASKYFGQDSGRLIRGEESKGVVELGDLKFLGEAKEPQPAVAPEPKKHSTGPEK